MRRMILAAVLGVLMAMPIAGCEKEPTIDDKLVSEWVSLLRHDDWAVQAQASEVLARMGAESIPYMRRPLRGTDPAMRRGIIRTLAKMGPAAAEAVPLLLARIAREKVSYLRVEVLDALARIAPLAPEVQAEFEKRQRDVDADVRAAANRGLELAKPPEAKAPPPAPPPIEPEGFLLRQAIREQLDRAQAGQAFGIAAEVVRGSRRAAIVWPALRDGKQQAGGLVAYVFERSGQDPWVLASEVGPLQAGEAAGKLSESLGGADDQRVVHPCGLPPEGLAGHLQQAGAAYREALAAGQADAAVAAYEDLTRAFSFGLVAYDDRLIEWVRSGAFDGPWTFELDAGGQSARVRYQAGGQPLQAAVGLRHCGEGVVISEIK